MINLQPWPFREPRDRGVFTTRQVLAGIYPILAIVHESGTGGWRFLDLQDTDPYDMVGITLEQMVEVLPPDVLDVAIGMPLYSRARRASVNDPWIRDSWDGAADRKGKSGEGRRSARKKDQP